MEDKPKVMGRKPTKRKVKRANERMTHRRNVRKQTKTGSEAQNDTWR